ncbi:Phospholipid scramblase 1 [Stylophora pistillata]|uniref:Phospholipid scramblase n=1 Tax=Stylophora pistillata TaxID=50429 RepID=A0A2B4SZL3_STYPI|nr:Phospholipid scramblase 1 [Stylophora pistillata]
MADQPHEYPQGYGYQQPQQSVIQQQPGAPGQISWMPAPQAPMGCPQGLEYLLAVNQILIHKTVDLVEGSYMPTPWKPKLEVQDAQHQHIMTINGPCCLCACLDMQFPVSSADGSSEIMITKQWTGCTRETFTDAANFGIQFPLDLDVKFKAILLGAAFLVDFMFFERSN